jgi:predicted flap endonuclease-1-like 5' DNA nuclease
MENLIQLATEMLLCLIIAALIGGIIGYLMGKIGRCDDSEKREDRTEKNTLLKVEKVEKPTSTSTATHHATAAATTAAKGTPVLKEIEEKIEETIPGHVQAFQKNLDDIEGDRPQTLPSPRNGIPDDLKEISGIGLKIEDALHELGIYHYDQIANWSAENIRWIDNYLNFKGRVERENWVGQAKILNAGMPQRVRDQAQAQQKNP